MTQVLRAGDAVYGGYVISKDGEVVFIKGAIPGEVIEVSVKEKKRDYSIADVIEVVEPSESRVEPRCRYFGECGGCNLQFVSYDRQVQMKSSVLMDCMKRIGEMEVDLAPAIFGPDFNYRRRAQFKVSKEGMVGFYRQGTRDVVSISECPLMTGEINSTLRGIKGLELSGTKEIHVTHGDALLALVVGREFDEELAESLITEAGFAGVAFSDGSYRGSGHVGLDLDGLTYTVSPWSFFQSNWELNKRVVRLITEGLQSLEGKRILDMYAGAGNFSLPLSPIASEIVAVEDNVHTIKDGQRNSSVNKIKKVKFIRGRAESVKLHGAFDIVVLDPPRPGLTKAAMERVLEIAPEKIIYVSCNPSTFARDLKKLKENYSVDSIRMIDLFPNTYHVESVAFLTKDGNY
jgi:23S rRNA (uracil1939-C5)-methyltransferase